MLMWLVTRVMLPNTSSCAWCTVRPKLNVYWLMVRLLVGVIVIVQCSKNLVLSQKLPSPPTKRALFLQKSSKILLCIFLEEEQQFSSVQFSRSVVSDSCDPMDCSTPGLPVHHQFPEFTQTHVHWVYWVIMHLCKTGYSTFIPEHICIFF